MSLFVYSNHFRCIGCVAESGDSFAIFFPLVRKFIELPPPSRRQAKLHRSVASYRLNLASSSRQKEKPPDGWLFFLAESVRFELTVGYPITSFQDWLLKPLGQLSIALNYTIFKCKSQASGAAGLCQNLFAKAEHNALFQS